MEEKKQPLEPKQRILNAAYELFAKKGYAGVGVREIAQQADVNISMISYYYNGKVGILKQILNEFHEKYYNAIKNSLESPEPIETKVLLFVKSMVNFVRENTDMAIAVFNTLPLDIEEIANLKVEKVQNLISNLGYLLKENGLDITNKPAICALGPSALSMVIFHFRFRPVQEKVFKVTFDDQFYEEYCETIATFFLNGLKGVNQRINLKKES